MKHRIPMITTCLIGAGLLVVAIFVGVGQKALAAQPTDPANTAHSDHAAHVAADVSQASSQTIETQLQTITAQLTEMLTRIERLEAIAQQQPGQSPPAAGMPMGAGNPPRVRSMPGMGSGAKPMRGEMAGMDMTGGGQGGMGGDPAITDQLAELYAKMQRLEATMQPQSGASSGAMSMGGKPGMGSGTKPMKGKMAAMSAMGEGNPPSGDTPGAMKPAGGMDGMSGDAPPPGMKKGMMGKMKGGMSGMSGGASPPSGQMGMKGMMTDRMKAMKDKMMGGMGGGAPAAGAPMGGAAPGGGMGSDKMEMGGMGGGSSGGGMGMMKMDKMKMAGMMGMMSGMDGKASSSMTMPSALPGFPGASHLYHVGATGFFLNHSQHITLSTEQQMMLNQIKEKAALDKASADRCVQEAEQDLWTLTAVDEPDNAQIEAKVAEIEKLKGDARLRFIGAIGRAANILNDEQRKILTGFAPSAATAPAAAPMAAMKDM